MLGAIKLYICCANTNCEKQKEKDSTNVSYFPSNPNKTEN